MKPNEMPVIDYLNDPDSVNINPNIINAIPQYQDMHIFAELTASRRARSVIVIGGDTQSTPDFKVNFIGNNQNQNNPNYLNFTTNYYDGSTRDNEEQFESFGIASIKVVVNSSYIPTVSIQFVDIRGLSFFNNENSKYRILFDFPPPVFNLKIKGYYGRTLSYDLHLVKYTSEFKSENGNFVIDAEFVAITFAPLSDVLFRYAINFPLIEDFRSESTIISDPKLPPKNTYEFILKIKNLLPEIKNYLNTESETGDFKRLSDQLTANNSTLALLYAYNEHLKHGTPYIFTVDDSVINEQGETNNSSVRPLNSFSDYDKNIKSNITGIKLYIGFITESNSSQEIFSFSGSTQSMISTLQSNELKAYAKELNDRGIKGSVGNIATESEISKPEIINNTFNISIKQHSNIQTSYQVIDITSFYTKLFKTNYDIATNRTTVAKSLNTKINNNIIGTLGMNPTIYNVFKLILDDVDTFFRKLRKTSQDAQDHHNRADNKGKILNGGMKDVGSMKASQPIYSFPLLIKITCGNKEEKTSPTAINQKLSPTEQFPESILISDFIDTFSKQKHNVINNNMKNEKDSEGNNIWIPISPQDSTIVSGDTRSPYFGLDSNTSQINMNEDKIINQYLTVILNRFYVLSEGIIPDKLYGDKNNPYLKFYSQSEALNLKLSVLFIYYLLK